MFKLRNIFLFITLLSLYACSTLFRNPLDIFKGDDDTAAPISPTRVEDATRIISLALGGVAPGRDELVFADADGNLLDLKENVLECAPEAPILNIQPRPGFESLAEGSGALLEPTGVGVTAVRCAIDGFMIEELFEVTIPPQSMIQILVAEAGEQLAEEAVLDPEHIAQSVVDLDSISVTGEAIASVIRNRVLMIDAEDDPSLFNVERSDFLEHTPSSYYDAVILAPRQFAPTSSDDPTHDTFLDAAYRSGLSGRWRVAYDQAVLTAAQVYNGAAKDPTHNAFAFRSPSEEEWTVLSAALSTQALDLPEGAGWTDESFPAYAPIQFLVLDSVWTYDDGRPAFVFVRSRSKNISAVVTE